ncbi:FAD/NAD(P)-binding protein [Streptomyces sp. NPDC003691]
MPEPAGAICVVGLGPRGLAVFERLCANHPAGRPLSVHVVDPYPPGPGRTWRTGQSPHLLMNTVTSQVSQFTDDSVPCAGPVRPGPSLHDWLHRPGAGDRDGSGARTASGGPGPGWAGPEAPGPDDYPSRAQYGRYLEWVFARLVATAPAGLTVTVHRATAVALDGAPGGQCLTLDDGSRLTGLDAVVLTLGHGPAGLSEEEEQLAAYAREHGLRYHPPANPADLEGALEAVGSGEPVALRGLGLVFFDVMALLTEGRGGKYVPSPGPDGGLQYLPSGHEPVLYAGSRRGVPYQSRGENQKGAAGRHEPLFLTLDAVRRIRAAPGATFREDVWPLLSAEVATVYHRALVAQWADGPTADRFLAEYLAAPAAGRTAVLRRYGVRAQDEWKWERVERPWGRRIFTDPGKFNRWLAAHLREDVRHARGGNLDDPLKAALDVLRDLRNEVRLAIDHGGVTGTSYRDEVVRWFTPLNAYLSIGPPPSRAAEMAALIDCGLLTVVGPRTRVRRDPGGAGFLFGSDAVPGSQIRATTLVEARIPDPDLRRSTDPLLRHLLATGGCRPYRIPDPEPDPAADPAAGSGGGYETGGLEVTPRPYRVVDAAGVPHPRRFAFGVPTENVHWATAAGIRPGVGSVILEDADAVARAVLGL